MIKFFEEYGAKIKEVQCGNLHTLFLTDDGEVLSCGVGEYGRLGTGSTVDASSPMPLETLANEDIVQISAGFDHSVALTKDGRIYSWGGNSNGQLGHADSFLDMYSVEDIPRLIAKDDIVGPEGLDSDVPVFKQVVAGNYRSAAVTVDGELYVWGARLNVKPQKIERALFDGQAVKKVGLGGDNYKGVIAVLTEDDSLWTFGDSRSSMIGRRLTLMQKGKITVPEQIPTFKNSQVLDIYTGLGQHMMAKVVVNPGSH